MMIGFTVLAGPMKQAVGQTGLFAIGRGGWSDHPFWFRIEFLGLAIVLVLCFLGLGWNRITRRKDETAHDLGEKFAEPTDVDECLKGL
jgi:hypothetical protein